ncbi:MAG: zf-HC2 domain-containing protein [Dehalococcoidales bacterium]|jgi:hypothetical protein|nr:zf-HC2 domain-containing protein [Dehalococcoidales bacterium]MDD4465534.1 zf-HC2 domain-containing protein [Dehalococcoidales bacterium]MDD5402369.1 zf-HC2 domain-containing protein [Dehalococcoidales bacterium]
MNCKDVNKRIADFLSGELSQKEKEQVLGHLAGCNKCREGIKALTDIEKRLRQLFDMNTAGYSIPDNMLERIKARIALEEQAEGKGEEQNKKKLIPRREWIPWRLSWKKAFAGALIICLVVVLSVIIPIFVSDNGEVLAIDIALNDPQVQAILGDRKPYNIETSEIGDDEHTFVILNIDSELLIIAEVNTGKKEVVQVSSL